MNGDFEVFAGDQIQWYWTFERNCFHLSSGKRKAIADNLGNVFDGWDPETDPLAPNPAIPVAGQLPMRDDQRRVHNDMQYGRHATENRAGDKSKHVARIKPYIRDDEQPRIYDWYRVFATAISSARPHELVDIKISRQSL